VQRAAAQPIALESSVKFVIPEFFIRLRSCLSETTRMSMPIAAVHEYYTSMVRENDVGTSRQIFSM
jgi:hypothetical protein